MTDKQQNQPIDDGLADRLAGRNKRHRYNLSAPAAIPGPKYNKDGSLSKVQPKRLKPKYTIPSVTTIINVMDKPGLVWGAAKEAAIMAVTAPKRWQDLPEETAINNIKVEHQRVWGVKAAIGTIVHDAAMSWTMGISYDIDAAVERHLTMALSEEIEPAIAKISGCLDALERFYDDQQPQWQYIERTVANPGFNIPVHLDSGEITINPGDGIEVDQQTAYMGGFDAMGTMKSAPNGAMIDLKTGSCYPESLTLQLAAYARAPYLCVYDTDGHLVKLERFQAPRYRAGLYLKEDGTYELIRVPAGKEAFQHFRYLRRVYEWRNKMTAWEKQYKKTNQTESENS